MRLIVALLIIICAWMLPLGTAEVLKDMEGRGYLSFGIMLAVILISNDLWAWKIAGIEVMLNICNLIIAYHWPNEIWLMTNYPAIQRVAFVMEILVLIGAAFNDHTDSDNDFFASYLRDILSRKWPL